MLDLLLYCVAIISGLILYWVHCPTSDNNHRTSIQPGKSMDIMTLCGINRETDHRFIKINDFFYSTHEAVEACLKVGMSQLRIIVGIDFSASNEWQGRRTFAANSLHKVTPGKVTNPYQRAIQYLSMSLDPYLPPGSSNITASTYSLATNSVATAATYGGLAASQGGISEFQVFPEIPVYGFGDALSTNQSVTPLKVEPCTSFQDVLEVYNESTRKLEASGPSSFKQLIRQAIDIVNQDWNFVNLVILTDGQFANEKAILGTIKAIKDAALYPLGITIVGLGDGPWELMTEFDDHLATRRFDNVNFVNFQSMVANTKRKQQPTVDQRFVGALMSSLPAQYDFFQTRNRGIQAEIALEDRQRRGETEFDKT